MSNRFFRGQIWAATLPGLQEEEFYLVISQNPRNHGLGTALVVRITSKVKPDLASIVRIPAGEPVRGRVLCDDIEEMRDADAHRLLGAFSPLTMRMVSRALRVALALD
ncbi:MAG: type II toxin-antitoxin system PemK/MazF family toxin [Microbacterium sp.]|uniref:type II toxin-antitoxin system PemK/MazF family toxin n=1 Tax=Microbacterium sp. TaxID=51671 RepID=UPI001AC45EFC|nr:type II toxin-antitoxin system PemK/MazF family toxin [Microbacterium sp.]MBN9153560.1 type II toxin-antitoxin system PemK/MazF family toxin [Microbacterium sp.]MBN9169787.1 type II toxin-antitoxin system PemK/MazF family toxin [Microbacterium sp.]MBN9172897.1 type II toxin-antitoxin system PemK/MazF family toxin [Microbacterium sp.]MBN9190280.1 type II toxin-antitoxin system PemK/MazF family toxin [Microbacterium sp.]